MIVADRGVLSEFAGAAIVTVAEPPPPPLNVSHGGTPDHVQPHPACVVTFTPVDAAAARSVTVVGDTEYVHVAVAVWVTVNVFPAIVSVPVRDAPLLFVATTNVTVALPRPGPALMIATQATLLAASHGQLASAVTLLLPNPPSDVNDRLEGEIDVVQVDTADCVTVNVVAAIVRVPVRAVVPVLGATVNATLPGPDPLPPEVIEIHEALLLASHGQAGPVVTMLLLLPPVGSKVWLDGEAVY